MPDNNDMPENVRKMLEANPDLMKSLANPEFIERINKQIAEGAQALSDWCVACGASASRAIPDTLVNPQPLSRDEIKTIGRRLLSSG